MERAEDMLHRKGVIGGCNRATEVQNGKYQKLSVWSMQEKNLKEVMVGHFAKKAYQLS